MSLGFLDLIAKLRIMAFVRTKGVATDPCCFQRKRVIASPPLRPLASSREWRTNYFANDPSAFCWRTGNALVLYVGRDRVEYPVAAMSSLQPCRGDTH